ncbi:hypothetical protein GUJ93_ZPchr0010g10028 [Zizania palustris]|uniref:Helitron helicase-like domain-containing protein n=1 Tax=Zizania palustris TaxID=103762 RepID=A0A8J5W7D3_ZIZPA|nr:hypothetical protein GUJ93_ZPchr0010g10028 [Zizania palustris]
MTDEQRHVMREQNNQRKSDSYARLTPEQRNNRRARDRARYASMPDEQRQLKRDQMNRRNSARRRTLDPNCIYANATHGSTNVIYQNLPGSTHLLKTQPDCRHCGAKRFEYEPPGFCCMNGKVKLQMPEPPEELRRLYSGEDIQSQHFMENIRYFNSHFSFTTMYCDYDKNLASARDGVYTFKAHGQMYHNIHSFGNGGNEPSHLQLYFYDDDPSLSHRFRRARDEIYRERDISIIRCLVHILRDNPYSETFRSLGQVEDVDEYRIVLNMDYKLDQRTYNRPLTSEVAAVWVEGNDINKHFDRSITLFGNNNNYYSIRPSDGCYDPLSYPLFFPRAELGWHSDIPREGIDLSQISTTRQRNADNAG